MRRSTCSSWPGESQRLNPQRESALTHRTAQRALTLAVISLALVFLSPTPVSADASAPSIYRQAVDDAYNLVRGAGRTDTATARSAANVLETGTGQSQPEILADLRSVPPDFDDARARLLALKAALQNPATTADPGLAGSRLHEVLSMSRYDSLHRAPSPLDRLTQWIGDRINDLLRLLFGGSGGPRAPAWLIYVVGVIAVVAVTVFVFMSARGRFTANVSANRPAGPRAPADYFSEADRLAARGDRVGAIRALCAGVAATLAGERTWEGSPLTVREIFQRAPDPQSLRPLLRPFEAAVYGGREVDAATYERAAQIAAPYRKPAAVAA